MARAILLMRPSRGIQRGSSLPPRPMSTATWTPCTGSSASGTPGKRWRLTPGEWRRWINWDKCDSSSGSRFKGYLDKVEIVMNNKNGCEKIPHMDMDEHCKCLHVWHFLMRIKSISRWNQDQLPWRAGPGQDHRVLRLGHPEGPRVL